VTSVTDSGAYAIIDVHNYARWNGEIIGQGGPSNDDVSASAGHAGADSSWIQHPI
jgi:endoglucanase